MAVQKKIILTVYMHVSIIEGVSSIPGKYFLMCSPSSGGISVESGDLSRSSGSTSYKMLLLLNYKNHFIERLLTPQFIK